MQRQALSKSIRSHDVESFIHHFAGPLLLNMFTAVFGLMIFVYGTLIDCLSELLRSLHSAPEDGAESYLMVFSSIVFRLLIAAECLTLRKRTPIKTIVSETFPLQEATSSFNRAISGFSSVVADWIATSLTALACFAMYSILCHTLQAGDKFHVKTWMTFLALGTFLSMATVMSHRLTRKVRLETGVHGIYRYPHRL